MSYYILSKHKRKELTQQIQEAIFAGIQKNEDDGIVQYFSDKDTYVRKSAYQAIGKIYNCDLIIRKKIITVLAKLATHLNAKVRQAAVNAAGEIGTRDFQVVEHFFDNGLSDANHSVRNAVIGSVKKMGNKNPVPVLTWAEKYLSHPDKEVRREVCHGIELRGRTHPSDILPLLKELQHDKTARVTNTLIHVLGQISYKKGCLSIVIAALNTWDNKQLTGKALSEIIAVHERYKNFAFLTQNQAIEFINQHSTVSPLKNKH